MLYLIYFMSTMICCCIITSGREPDRNWYNYKHYKLDPVYADKEHYLAPEFRKSSYRRMLRWVDHVETDPEDMDLFFDRIAMIVIKDDSNGTYLQPYRVLGPAVLFKEDSLLTSFNPYAPYIMNNITDFKSDKYPSVVLLRNRTVTDWKSVSYENLYRYIVCGRRVIPTESEEGMLKVKSRELTPMHDLMVFRLLYEVPLEPNGKSAQGDRRFKMEDYRSSRTNSAGPIRSILAHPNDTLTGDLIMGSLAFRDHDHIYMNCELYAATFPEDEKVQENCDEWLPRDWGSFICIRNIHHFVGVGSGAMLYGYSNKMPKLFGVGSFVLGKGSTSVIVFTDVRKYWHLIYGTCSDGDQAAIRLKCGD